MCKSLLVFHCRPNNVSSFTVSEIFNVDLAFSGRGHSRSLKVAPVDTSYTASRSSSIVTITLSRIVLELFDRDLEIWVKGHSGCLKMVLLESLGTVSYSHSIATMDTVRSRQKRWLSHILRPG